MALSAFRGRDATTLEGAKHTRHFADIHLPSSIASPSLIVAFCPRERLSSQVPFARISEVDVNSASPLSNWKYPSESMSPLSNSTL